MVRPPPSRERPITQVADVKRVFPHFRWTVTRRGGLDWSGTLQPTKDSPVYRVRLLHEPSLVPKVWVITPQLRRDAPHRWPQDGSLCLFWPREWQWRPRESLAATMIPWAAFWLYFHEIWLVTADWLGPSSPHQPGKRKDAA